MQTKWVGQAPRLSQRVPRPLKGCAEGSPFGECDISSERLARRQAGQARRLSYPNSTAWFWLTATLRRLLLLFAFLAFPSAVFAHRLDEYLQATLVVIEPGVVRLQINLTPGVDVAEKVQAQIDRDRNGAISRNEEAAYAEMLKRDLTLRLDGRELKLKVTASEFPALVELRSGLGIIQIEFSATVSRLATGPHKLTFENRHLTTLSVYLINAAQPKSHTIQIVSQKRTENQGSGEIEFTFHSSGSP